MQMILKQENCTWEKNSNLIEMSELRQTLEQKLKLLPQQLLQTALLQLNSLALEGRIEEELAENPLLELTESSEEPEENGEQDEEFEIDWDDYEYEPIRTPQSKSTDRQEMPLPAILDPIDLLLEQISLLEIPAEDRLIAEEIAWNVDEKGYLATDVEIIVDRLGVTEEDVERVLFLVQHLTPPGIGARNLKECLTAQLEVMGGESISKQIVIKYFEDFANRRFEKLKQHLGCSQEELNEAMEVIAHLNPKPGEGSPTSAADYILPDFFIEEVDGELVITLNDSNLPDLQISPVYRDMLISENGTDAQTKKFLRRKMESAKWFLQAVQSRQITMMKVMKTIMDIQPEFFKGEISALKPMILKDVADKIEMDISTVSRVTRGKYVQTPFGIYELKHFFTEGLTTSNGEEVSTRIVKEELKKVVEGEDKTQPYSDDKLAEIMAGQGYPIARRTVAKYREQLTIPVARLRREL